VTQQTVIKDFRSDLLSWAYDNLRTFPWRETDDPYEILIAEILLQKTAAEKVDPVYREFLSTYPSLNELAAADREELADIIYSLGLQNQRSLGAPIGGPVFDLRDRRPRTFGGREREHR